MIITYCNVKGFAKNTKDITIVNAFRNVVTVTAVKAPDMVINVRTI